MGSIFHLHNLLLFFLLWIFENAFTCFEYCFNVSSFYVPTPLHHLNCFFKFKYGKRNYNYQSVYLTSFIQQEQRNCQIYKHIFFPCRRRRNLIITMESIKYYFHLPPYNDVCRYNSFINLLLLASSTLQLP